MRAPGFWQSGGWAAWLLAPLSPLTGWLTARRLARPGWRAPVPVLCCGNATVGGAGKTPLALDLVPRLQARGHVVHVLTRGHGGKGGRGAPLLVAAGADAATVGDEPLLLAAVAPTWVGRDRAAAARCAVAAGATCLVMDDGLQNPGLVQDLGLLVIEGGSGFGNGRRLPAGPLRESVARAASRCRAAVLIGEDATGALAALPPGMEVLRATLRQVLPPGLAGRRVFAFAGIGRPEKFRASLAAAGVTVAGFRDFPDHHFYTAREGRAVLAAAAALDAVPVTTAKDAVRLPPALRTRVAVAGMRLEWEDAGAIERLLPKKKDVLF